MMTCKTLTLKDEILIARAYRHDLEHEMSWLCSVWHPFQDSSPLSSL